MLRLFMNNTLFYSFDENENLSVNGSYIVTAMTLKKEVNSLSQLNFTTLITHQRVNSIHLKRTLFVLADDNTCLFIGKPLSINRSMFNGTVEVECEELIGCLRDEIAIDVAKPDSDSSTERRYIELLEDALHGFDTYGLSERDGIFGYNCEVPSNQLPAITKIGISVNTDSKLNDKTTSSYFGSDYLSIIYSTVNSYTGGVIYTNATGSYAWNASTITYTISSISIQYRVDLRDATRDASGYYDITYVPQSVINNNDFACKENIISIESEQSQKYPISVILPYASYKDVNDSKNQHTIYLKKAQVYNSAIIENADAVAVYGRVAKGLDFGDLGELTAVNAENNLHTFAQAWAMTHLRPYCEKYTITGVDKYFVNGLSTNRTKPIDICDLVHVHFAEYVDDPTKRDYFDYVLSLSIDFFDHEQDQYTVGPYIPDNILDYNASNIESKNAKYGEAVMSTAVPGIKGMRMR